MTGFTSEQAKVTPYGCASSTARREPTEALPNRVHRYRLADVPEGGP